VGALVLQLPRAFPPPSFPPSFPLIHPSPQARFLTALEFPTHASLMHLLIFAAPQARWQEKKLSEHRHHLQASVAFGWPPVE